jgi:hypothetical protein
MAQLPQDRIVRKEVALGAIREIPPPQNHIGLAQIAPFLEVQSDDVIFSYVLPDTDGLAPARAEDSESELAQKDDSVGTGRASLIDWALKDHYDPSDVSRYREFQQLADLAAGGGNFPLSFLGRMANDFPAKVARDTARRRRKLDNRAEWLIMTALETGSITYNDGKIKFTVSYGRPGGQQNAAPTGALWSNAAADPIGDIMTMTETMYNTYSVTMTRAITSRRVLRSLFAITKFNQAMTYWSGQDARYLPGGFGGGPITYEGVVSILERATGIRFQVYDAVYRTRAAGSTTVVNNRFTNDDKIIFLPSEDDIAELSDTDIGFAKMHTSPHPEGGWTSGFYEWEKDTGPDPWGRDFGTGIKMFPVFPHLETTYVMDVL